MASSLGIRSPSERAMVPSRCDIVVEVIGSEVWRGGARCVADGLTLSTAVWAVWAVWAGPDEGWVGGGACVSEDQAVAGWGQVSGFRQSLAGGRSRSNSNQSCPEDSSVPCWRTSAFLPYTARDFVDAGFSISIRW